MLDQVKGFVEFRYDHLSRQKIVRSYIMILFLNIVSFIPVILLSRDIIVYFLSLVMLITYFIVVNIIIFQVKKLMLRTYLFLGTTSVYSGILFALIFYYFVKGYKDHNFPLILMIIASMILGSIINYMLIKKSIENGKFLEKREKYKWTTGKALLLVGGIVAGRFIIQAIRYFELDKLYPAANYWLTIFSILVFLFILSGQNMILLKAHYIKKYNLEKDECKYINLADRLG